MNEFLKNKIRELLTTNVIQGIINSDEFYFQKAKEALQNFLKLEVKEETKDFLLSNKKEYNDLKQLFEDENDLSVFGKLLFSVIAYCDSNANNKRELNEYENNRVLALAFVRMNNWVEQLITYKFEGYLVEGSVKNALDYLLNPADNFTMLSENHRSQISQNLFKNPYNKTTFKDDFFAFFSEFSIQVRNSENYTHLLTRLSYDIDKEWKDSVIGLISPDSTGWQGEAVNKIANGNHIALWNHKKPNGIGKTLKLLRQRIDEDGFFRIFYTANYNVIYVAEVVDFVCNQNDLNKAKWPENYGTIEWYNDNFSNYTDGSKSASWIYLIKKIEKVDPDDYWNFQYFNSFSYPSVGCQAPVISYQKRSEINYKNQMSIKINLLKYKKQIILQGPPGTGKTREAKLIALEMLDLKNVEELKDNNQFKIVQFHPSYTYEDFVRGIVAESKGEKIEYKNVHKILGLFAEEALKNYKASNSNTSESNIEIWIESKFEEFKNNIEAKLPEEEVSLSGDITIFEITDSYFKYAKSWQTPGYLNFNEFKKIVKAIILGEFELSNKQLDKGRFVHAHYRYTYYNALLRIFFDEYIYQGESYSEDLKNYVLIIDEINRANLSSVLGELIYALEYRGEAVESMYAVEDDNKLILPPNLYIIGTMNTADRSVGHIDYAIRRRFAFVDVLPENLKETQGLESFDEVLFNEVQILFNTYLSPEFEKKDVQLGHSYFIDKSTEKDGAPMTIRLEYEIKPILLEYVKDGVLTGEKIKRNIESLKVSI